MPVPGGAAADAAWLRAFHAVVPAVVPAFRPQVLVTQHGADSHRDDPLADLNLTVDGQLAAYRALRDLAERAADGRWLALGGGGYALVRVVPRAWTHLLAWSSTGTSDPATPIPEDWRGSPPRRPVPTSRRRATMTDGTGAPPGFDRWDGHGEGPVDRVDHRGAACGVPGLSGSIPSTPVTDPPVLPAPYPPIGRRTSCPPTARWCTSGRSRPTTPTRSVPCTAG